MNNLASGCTSDMVEATFRAVPRNIEYCADCLELFRKEDMHPWSRHDFHLHSRVDVFLCEACVPKCGWRLHDIWRNPCLKPASPNSPGGWCMEHEVINEAMELAEEEANVRTSDNIA